MYYVDISSLPFPPESCSLAVQHGEKGKDVSQDYKDVSIVYLTKKFD